MMIRRLERVASPGETDPPDPRSPREQGHWILSCRVQQNPGWKSLTTTWMPPYPHWTSLVATVLLSLVAISPIHAQYGTRPDGSSYLSRSDYMNAIQGRVAVRNDLEGQWTAANRRVDQHEEAIERLKNDPPPSGVSPTEWNAFKEQEIRRLENVVTQNESHMGSIQRQLTKVYDRLSQDNDFLRKAGSGNLSQEIGTLIGAGGVGLVPVWSRPTPGNLSRASAYARNVTQLQDLHTQIPQIQTDKFVKLSSLNAGQQGPQGWQTRVNQAGNIELHHGTNTVDLKIPAEVKAKTGELVPNQEGFTQARAYSDLYNARQAIDASKTQLQIERARASDMKAVGKIDKQISTLEGQKSQLDKDIRQYENSRAGKGPIQGLISSAAKWAAFSAGITVGSEVISQLAHNGWNVKAVDWRRAVDPLTKASFWGGTAGSFGVSMIASMIPGGTFIKTLASIGGAAVGWQLGSGEIGNTDWAGLGATTVGATVGSLLGGALGGGIGRIAGGIAGHMAANWLMGMLRDHLSQPTDSFSPGPVDDGDDFERVDPADTLSGYLDQMQGGTTPFSGGSPTSSADPAGAPRQTSSPRTSGTPAVTSSVFRAPDSTDSNDPDSNTIPSQGQLQGMDASQIRADLNRLHTQLRELEFRARACAVRDPIECTPGSD